MIVHIPNVLSQEQVAHCREVMNRARVGGWPRHLRLPIEGR